MKAPKLKVTFVGGMRELKLPVKFDEDFDIVDADGFPLLFGADMIDHHPELGQEIMKRVNAYDELLSALKEVCNYAPSEMAKDAYALLESLEADQ